MDNVSGNGMIQTYVTETAWREHLFAGLRDRAHDETSLCIAGVGVERTTLAAIRRATIRTLPTGIVSQSIFIWMKQHIRHARESRRYQPSIRSAKEVEGTTYDSSEVVADLMRDNLPLCSSGCRNSSSRGDGTGCAACSSLTANFKERVGQIQNVKDKG